MKSGSPYINNDLCIKKLFPLIEFLWLNKRIDIIDGRLYIDNELQCIKAQTPLIQAIAHYINQTIAIYEGFNKKHSIVTRSEGIHIQYFDLNLNSSIGQSFNETIEGRQYQNGKSIKKVSKSFGCKGKNTALAKFWIRCTGEISPNRWSRLPATKLKNLLFTGKLKPYRNGGAKFINETVVPVNITYECLIHAVPEEWLSEITFPFDSQPLTRLDTIFTQQLPCIRTVNLHRYLP